MNISQIVLVGVVVLASHTCIAQPAQVKPPPAIATLPAAPPQLGSPADHEIVKLRYELAKLAKDQAAELVKLKADLAKQTDLLANLTSTYNEHSHGTTVTTFGNTPAKAYCSPGKCSEEIWYQQLTPQFETRDASKPHPWKPIGG